MEARNILASVLLDIVWVFVFIVFFPRSFNRFQIDSSSLFNANQFGLDDNNFNVRGFGSCNFSCYWNVYSLYSYAYNNMDILF